MFKKLFLIKEIKSKEGILHFRRWRILSTPWFNIYIHEIFKADEDLHLHDHPWNYRSYIIKGSFEELYTNSEYYRNVIQAQSVRSGMIVKRLATTFHKVEKIHSSKIVTLFITGRKFRDWGYLVDGEWVQHTKYRALKNFILHDFGVRGGEHMEYASKTNISLFKGKIDNANELLKGSYKVRHDQPWSKNR